jgi:hypothetical protein
VVLKLHHIVYEINLPSQITYVVVAQWQGVATCLHQLGSVPPRLIFHFFGPGYKNVYKENYPKVDTIGEVA